MIRTLALALLISAPALAAPKHTKAELDAAAAAAKALIPEKDIAKVAAVLDSKLGEPDKVLKGVGIASWYALAGKTCFELRFAFAGGPMVANVVETFASNCK